MSSYLSNLAARAVQPPQSIRPRLASLFESTGPRIRLLEPIGKKQTPKPKTTGEGGNEPVANPAPMLNELPSRTTPATASTEVIAESREVTHRDGSLHPSINRVSEAFSSHPLQPTVQEAAANRTQAPGEFTADSSGRLANEPHSATTVNQAAPLEPPATEVIEQTVVIESELPSPPGLAIEARKSRHEPAISAALTVRPDVAASRSRPPAYEAKPPSQESPQSIRITIGRVEVRAVMPQAPPATNTARKAAAVGPLSLDEYLKKRNGA